MTFPGSSKSQLSNPLRLLFQIVILFHGKDLAAKIVLYNIQKEEDRTGQKLKVNDRH